MWSDKFDLDLYNLLPETKQILAPVENMHLYTRSSLARDGVTWSHPTIWNSDYGSIAYFGFLPKDGKLPETGPQPSSYWSDEPIVRLTAAEAIRDCWLHTYCIAIDNKVVWGTQHLLHQFDVLMAACRKYGSYTSEEVESATRIALADIKGVVEVFRTLDSQRVR